MKRLKFKDARGLKVNTPKGEGIIVDACCEFRTGFNYIVELNDSKKRKTFKPDSIDLV